MKIRLIMSLFDLIALNTANALEFIVNTTNDTVDATSECSLRAAMMQTNQLSTEDTIELEDVIFITGFETLEK